ncbi:MAG: KpsF/GutQ family sugar-phosphate isomerase [Lentisphaerae bacterium]|jgi:arabinose-5-phosphate isomerase|nr:KpsF/GutQ family sugar-phosphate isomerase [Lentisphaerota bacterium]
MTRQQYLDRARQVLTAEANGIAEASAALDEHFCDTIELLLKALANGGKIVVTGVGKNLHIAEKMAATLASTGSTSVMLNPMQAMHGDLGMLTNRDVLLALSFSGESDELIALIPAVRRLGASVVAITGNCESSLAKCANQILPVKVACEACPFNLAPTTSTTATLAIGDALAMVLLDARGFAKKDYALLHPAGAIGRALLCRVHDIMRTGEKIAVLTPERTVRDAIIAMTGAKCGSACVTTPDGTLAGIFTDGDLRRLMASNPDVINDTLQAVMTANPIRVKADRLAVDVLRIFEEYKIDDLPVVDDADYLVGCVDIQDLPRMKLM